VTSLWSVAALPVCIALTFTAFGIALHLAGRRRP
jgi:hypothetical protein